MLTSGVYVYPVLMFWSFISCYLTLHNFVSQC